MISRRGASRALTTALLVSVAVLPARQAAAEPTAKELAVAREAFARAEKEEEHESWAAALEDLRKVAAVKMTAGVRFHIANCEAGLGQDIAALDDYLGAEKLAREEHNKDVVDASAEPIAALRAKIPTVVIRVPSDVTDAQITLDAKPLESARWGTSIPLEPGTHRIEARAPGRTPYSTSLTVKDREANVLEVRLTIAPPAPVAAARPLVAPPPEEEKSSGHTAAIIATGGAVLLAGAGIGAFLVAGGKQSDAQSTCATSMNCTDAKSPVQLWDGVALGAWAGAAVVGTVAVILWLRPSSSTRIVAGPSTLRLEGKF
ncbi:MAG: hypothetical protein ABIP39_13690 [Polyangiaceae bacterium]